MISLCVIPNFKGTKLELLKVTICCLLLDSTYMIPMFKHII